MESTFYWDKKSGLALDFAYAQQPPDASAHGDMPARALKAMQMLEAGALANPDEGRMVGHYWLRNPQIAPSAEISAEIAETNARIADFAHRVHSGEIAGAGGRRFKNVLVIGIGGSSLGARFVSAALRGTNDKMRLYFIDNTDPDGIDSVFAEPSLKPAETLVVVISKSGGTVETRNGMAEAQSFFAAQGVDFFANAVRITQRGSSFDTASSADKWLAVFPMWDWVGGRTSVLSAVGLLPLALQGIDIDGLLRGAAECDALGRQTAAENPAMLLALFWYRQTGGRGGSVMAVLPYKDRLGLLARYLQQLVMESLGKEKNLAGDTVRQGLAVLGNKGSTDQHSYMQQLVAGPENAFAVFIEVLKDRAGVSPAVRGENTAGDYLQAFMLGTAQALYDNGKSSAVISVPEVSAYYIGMLIALFERTVGFYASFIGINAYNQPAVEQGKASAEEVIALINRLYARLKQNPGRAYAAAELAEEIGREESCVWHCLQHLAANRADISAEGDKFRAVDCED